jgi:hypothetical protein
MTMTATDKLGIVALRCIEIAVYTVTGLYAASLWIVS